jgi:hypothetical protein
MQTRNSARTNLAALLAAGLLAAGCGGANDPQPPPDCTSAVDTTGAATVSFAAQIVPLLSHYECASVGCHGGDLSSSNYRVDTHADVLTMGDEATDLGVCVVKPGRPDESYMIWKLEGRQGIRGEQMPNGMEPVLPEDLEIFRTWIAEGARGN